MASTSWRSARIAGPSLPARDGADLVVSGSLIPEFAPRLARGVLSAMLLCYFGVALMRLYLLDFSATSVAVGLSAMTAVLLVQLFYFGSPRTDFTTPRALALLAVQAVVTYAPLAYFGLVWIGLPGILAGSALLVLRPRYGWVAFGLIVASGIVVGYIQIGTVIDAAYVGASNALAGLVVFGLTRLTRLVAQLQAARLELAELAVAKERLRFARDLHDLLGYSLSAIALKGELTHRLIATEPDAAEAEVSEILDISRQALADVRAVASGYRSLSFDDEVESANAVLTAAGVKVHLDLCHERLSTQVGTTLAIILREAVTNVLRHSTASCCTISVRNERNCVSLDVLNDGVHDLASRGANGEGGSGLANLRTRVADLGGTLTTDAGRDQFRLRATVSTGPAGDPNSQTTGEALATAGPTRAVSA